MIHLIIMRRREANVQADCCLPKIIDKHGLTKRGSVKKPPRQGEMKLHTGKKVRLRAIREEDLDTIVRIWMDNSLLASDKIPYPLELEEVREYLKKIRSDGNGYIFAVETLADHSMIGTINVSGINWHHRYAYVGISLDSELHNRGCGTDAMEILLRFIFEEMNLHKVKLEVFEFNPRAIRVYEKCGFRQEGRLREEIFRYGRYHDVLVMGLLQEEYRSTTG